MTFQCVKQLLSSRSSFTIAYCIVGFLLAFKPSEPFLTQYMLGDKEITPQQLTNEVYPWWTYSYFIFLIPVGIIAALFNYRIVIISGIITREATRFILLFGTGLFAMRMTQLTFGYASAVNIVYYSYIYLLFPCELYQRITGFSHAASLIGHMLAGILGQVLFNAGYPLRLLFIISAVTVSVGGLLFILMPNVSDMEFENCKSPIILSSLSSSVNRNSAVVDISHKSGDLVIVVNSIASEATSRRCHSFSTLYLSTITLLKRVFIMYTTSVEIWILSLWWTIGLCINDFVLNYNTVLWNNIDSSVVENGYVLAGGYCAGAVSSLIISLPITEKIFGLQTIPDDINTKILRINAAVSICFIIGSVCSAILLYLMATVANVYTSYIIYIIYYLVIQYQIALVSSQVAVYCRRCDLDRSNEENEENKSILNQLSTFAPMFCLNTFLSLCVETALQIFFNSHHYDAAGIFKTLAVCSSVVAILITMVLSITSILKFRRKAQVDMITYQCQQDLSQFDENEIIGESENL